MLNKDDQMVEDISHNKNVKFGKDLIGCFLLEGCFRGLMEYSDKKYILTEDGDRSLSPLRKSLETFCKNGLQIVFTPNRSAYERHHF